MVKCEKFTNKYVPNKHTEKSVNFPIAALYRKGYIEKANIMGTFKATN